MGNQVQKSKSQQQLQNEYRINHPILEQTQIYTDKNIMKTHLPSHEDIVIESWMKSTQKIKGMNKQYLLTPKTILFRENALCGTYSSLTVMYDCYPYVLMDEIHNRLKIQGTFEEDEIWYLLWVLADTSKSMIDIGQKLGDIRPHNILFNQTGDVKVINKFSWPAELTNYCKTLYERTTTYLSPEQLQLLVAAEETDKTSSQLSEAFSIGLTILSLICLDDLSKLYQFDPVCYGINTSKLASLLQKLPNLMYYNSSYKKKFPYSHGLIRVVQRLCVLDPEKRLEVVRLWEWLKPHKANIISFKPFELIRGIGQRMSPQKPSLSASPSKPTIQPTNLRSPIQLLQHSYRTSHDTITGQKNTPVRTTHVHPHPVQSFQTSQQNSKIGSGPTTAHQLKNRMNAHSIVQHQAVTNQQAKKTTQTRPGVQINFQSPPPNYAPTTHLGDYQKQTQDQHIIQNKATNITFSDEKRYKIENSPGIYTESVVESIYTPKPNPIHINQKKPQEKEQIYKINVINEEDDIIAQVDRQLNKSKKLFPTK